MNLHPRANNHRGGAPTRLAVAAAACALVLAAVPGTAFAAAPANDLPAGAVAITALPATVDQDTTEATVAPADDIGCGAGGTDQATVWYALTLPATTNVAIDAAASDYPVGINVYEGSASAGALINCVETALSFEAQGGTTYYVMFADIDGDATNGGQLSATFDVAPPPIEVSFTIDPVGKVNAKTNEATISGTITCSAETGDAGVDVQLRQSVGRFAINGFGFAQVECGPTPSAWFATVAGENGRFGSGKATVQADAFACDQFGCSDTADTVTVRLRK